MASLSGVGVICNFSHLDFWLVSIHRFLRLLFLLRNRLTYARMPGEALFAIMCAWQKQEP
jgi:hypothetical protein